MSSIFLSHSHADKVFARKLSRDLRAEGHIVWIDEAEINVGESLMEKISDGLARVDFIGVILSTDSVESAWVRRELELAIDRELREKRDIVIPILLHDVDIPAFLRGKRYADFRGPRNYRPGLGGLIRTLGPSRRAPEPDAELVTELKILREQLKMNERDRRRQQRLVAARRTPQLQHAIDGENSHSPQWSAINNAYAFEAMGIAVTVGYALHSIAKARERGSSPLTLALHYDDKEAEFEALCEAVSDFARSKRSRKHDQP
jgi:hypothetical protein